MASTRMAFAIICGEGFENIERASVTAKPFSEQRNGDGAALPRRAYGFYSESEERTHMDALTAAKARIERAMNELERKLQELQDNSKTATLPDDDLFAPDPSQAGSAARVAELEAAGQEAASALAAAASAVREILEQPAGESITDPSDVSEVESR